MELKFKKGHHLEHRDTEGIFNSTVEISEKLDGANMSCKVSDDNELICRSRNRELNREKPEKMFARAMEYLHGAHATTPFPKGFVPFGECMTKHTINYGETPPFIGYAVFDIEKDRYIEDWPEFFDSRNIPRVDFFVADNLRPEDLDKFLNQKSAWGTENATAEGLFIKNYGDDEHDQIFGKIVISDFLEKNAEIFGKPMAKMDDTSKIANMFCTSPRIHKGIFKLRDEYEMPVDMHMMKHLPLEVYNDIFEEEFITIRQKYDAISLKRLRKIVSSMCAITLKDFIRDQFYNKQMEE